MRKIALGHKTRMSAFVLVGLSMLTPASAETSDSGSPVELDLGTAIQLAIAHSTSVQSAQDTLKAAHARVGQQRAHIIPQLSLAGEATRYDNKTTVPFGSLGTFELMPDHQEQLGLVLAEDIDVSNEVGSLISQARLNELADRYELDAAGQEVALMAATDYYRVLQAAESVKVAQASLDDYREQLRTTTKLYEGGVGLKIDVLRAESQVADAQRQLTQRLNDLSEADSTLNDEVGRPLDQPLALKPIEPDAAEFESFLSRPADRSALIARALDRRSEALAASIQVAAARKGIVVARAASGPAVSLSLAGTHYPSTSFTSPRENVGTLTLSVSVPIFDGGLVREQVREAHAFADSEQVQADQVRRTIALQVQNADLDLRTAIERLRSARVALVSAEQARKLAQQRYEAQVGLYLEVTDAQAELTSAQAAVVDAQYDLLTARARLSRALNDPIVPNTTSPNSGTQKENP